MGFGTPPHPVACLLSNHGGARGDVYGVFEVAKLDLFDGDAFVGLFPVDEEIVRFDIYPE